MANLLSKITSTIPAMRRRAIRRLIQEAITRGDVSTNDQAQTLVDRITAKVLNQSVKSIMVIRKAVEGERVSSEDWNSMQEEMFVDIHALYEQTKSVNLLAAKHSEISRAGLKDSKAAINKAVNDIRRYQFLKQFPDYQDAKYIDFNDSRNTATRSPLASVDTQVRKLELPVRSRARLQQANIDMNTTTVTIKSLGGGISNGFDESFLPEQMLDDNPDTFWADLILTDGRIQQTYTPSSDAGLGNKFTSNGTIAEVTLQLSNTQRINNITLMPFGAYPVRIIDLAYKETSSANTWITVPGFKVNDASLDWLEWSFSTINMSSLRVTLEQVNFAAQIFHLPESMVHNQSLWSQILDQKFDNSIHQVELTEVDNGKIAAEPEMLAYLNALDMVNDELQKFAMTIEQSRDHYEVVANMVKASGRILSKVNPKEINKVIKPLGEEEEPDVSNPKVVEIRKNEFIYGIRSINLSNILYKPEGHYASPKFVSGATILDLSVDTDEEHPVFNDGIDDFRRTCVEHEVEIGENTRFPILPANSAVTGTPDGGVGYMVEDEYIPVIRTTQIGITRFKPASVNVVVRKNGARQKFNNYTFTIDATTALGRLTIVNKYDANAIYTISYVANEESAIVDINTRFNSTDISTPDIFTGTNRNNSIKTKYFPYIEYEIVNNSGQWYRDDIEDAKWRFLPTKQNYRAGTVGLTDGSLNITGVDTTWDTGVLDLSAGVVNVFRVKGESKIYVIQSVPSVSSIVLDEAYDGDTATGLEYQIGQGFQVDGRLYGLDEIIYEPVQVFINDIKAFNLTDYKNLEHPAFIPVSGIGRHYQYIHAGNTLYFNTSIENARIEVTYPWLTQYVQLKSTLRCNIPVRTNVTPKVDAFTIKIKNSKL